MHLVESQPPSVPLEQASYSNLVSRHPMSASLNAPLLAPGSETPDHGSYISSRGVVSSSSHAPSRPQRQRTSSKGGLAGIIQRRKAARRGFARLDDNDTAEIDAAAKREIMVAWCCRLSLVCSLIDLTVWAAFLAINFHSGVNAFWFQHVKHYNAVSSMADVMAVACVRAVIALANLAFVRSDNDRSNALTFLAYWSSALFFAAVLCKAIIFTGWSNARTCPFFACEIVLSALLFFAQHRMRRGDTTAVYDPAAAEEEEARQTRARANEAAKKRAAEIAAGLEGAELAEHLAKESARAAAAEYVEKSITRATKMSIKKQTMRFREIFLLLQPYFAPEGAMGRLRVAATWMFLIAARAMNIIGPLFIGRVTNILVNDKRIPYFEIACYCGLAFGSTLMRQSQNVVYRKVKQNAFVHVAQFTFRHLHGLSLQWHLNKKMGNVLRSMDRGIASADSVVSVIFMFLFPAIVECSIIFVIFYIHYGEPYLSSIVFAHLVAYFIITVQVTIWRKKYKRATNKHDNEFHDRATDSLINYETVKYFGNEDYEATRYTEAVLKYQSFAIRTQLSLAVLGTLQSFITQLCLCSCMLVSAHRVVSGHITIGQFSSVCAYVVQLFTPLAMLGQNYDMLVQAFVDMANLSELLAEEPDIVDEPNAVPLRLVDPQRGAEIEFRDVVFSYGDHEGSAGIKGISFTIPRGTSTAVVGTTGAGKSTIGRLLFRFYDVKSGQVTIDGVDIRTVTQASLRRTIGVVPQDTVMFNDTLLHNLRYGRMDATLEEVEEACRQAQLLDFILALPAQWETKVGERGLRLSGGEKQRVAIARALLKDPPVVLLDEATSALDTVKEQEIQSALRGLENGRTTLVIAHRLSTVMHAEQIIVLEQGEIIERGSHEALIAMGGKYASLWAQQASKDAEDAVAAATAAIAANAEADGEDEEGGALVTVSTEPNTPSPTATGPTSPVVPDGDEVA